MLQRAYHKDEVHNSLDQFTCRLYNFSEILSKQIFSIYFHFIRVFVASPILAHKRYVIEGNVENVAYSISSAWPCYIALNSPGDENSLKFHTTRHMAACEYATKMKVLKLPVRMIAEHWDGASHTAILIMDAGTSATFYIDELSSHIHDDRE